MNKNIIRILLLSDVMTLFFMNIIKIAKSWHHVCNLRIKKRIYSGVTT